MLDPQRPASQHAADSPRLTLEQRRPLSAVIDNQNLARHHLRIPDRMSANLFLSKRHAVEAAGLIRH
jgi:hypothetical protein